MLLSNSDGQRSVAPTKAKCKQNDLHANPPLLRTSGTILLIWSLSPLTGNKHSFSTGTKSGSAKSEPRATLLLDNY